jgi:hypothetical protein
LKGISVCADFWPLSPYSPPYSPCWSRLFCCVAVGSLHQLSPLPPRLRCIACSLPSLYSVCSPTLSNTLIRLSSSSMAESSHIPLRVGTIHLTPYPRPPPYTPMPGESQRVRPSWISSNPRSSSTQSLVPSESGEPGRRTLLLIYVHGFLGNESSFQSFPAHIHNLLKVTLAETHVIHTKIYPRYKSRKAIEFVRDEFSTWYAPFELAIT